MLATLLIRVRKRVSWRWESAVEGHDGDGRVTLTVSRKRLPVVSVGVSAEHRAAAEAVAEAIRSLSARV